MSSYTTETLRKAEAIEKALESQQPVEDITESMEIQIEPVAGRTSMSAINLSQESQLANQTDKVDTVSSTGIKENFRLASSDLDFAEDPFDESLCYDDPPPQTGPIEDELNNITDVAAQRVTEAKDTFGPIANILDYHRRHAPDSLPAKQASALKKFSKEIMLVAKHHFEAYVRGVPAQTCNYENSEEKITASNHNIGKTKSKPSYAQVATAGSKATHQNAAPDNNIEPRYKKNAKSNTDDRLFLRLSEGDKLRSLSPYALLSHLKTSLGPDAHLLVNAQITKSGFALCPKADESSALKDKISSISLLSNVTIDNATPWTSYKIQNVPRSYGTLSDDYEHQLIPVTTTALSDALTAAIGTTSISVKPSQENDINPHTSSTSWIVRFSEAPENLPRVLFLFGCRTVTRELPRRRATIQCSRCWLWHNSRTCASSPKCRLCDSLLHTEIDHTNLCSAEAGHVCPPRCIHCHGPHAADYSNCDLYPKPSGPPKTKSQVSAIRRINAEARMRQQAELGCVKPTTDPSLITTATSTQNLTASPAAGNKSHPDTARSNNLYAVLDTVEQSNDQIDSQ